MPHDDRLEEPFAFWLTNEFLAADTSAEEAYNSDQVALLTGSLLFVVVVLFGFIVRGNS